MTANDVLSGTVNTGGRVVVVGGGCVGAETANHLVAHLKSVTLVEMLDQIATDEMIVPRWDLLKDSKENNIRISTNTTVEEIKDGAVKVKGAVNEEIPADTVVLAVGAKSVNGLANTLKAEGYDVRVIGDASKTGLVGEPIAQGFDLGRAL